MNKEEATYTGQADRLGTRDSRPIRLANFLLIETGLDTRETDRQTDGEKERQRT